MRQADLIVIGSGPGGYEIAAEAANKGLDVIIFEKDKVGGTCLNRGCIPTKCLCAAAERLNQVRGAAEFGIDVSGVSADYATVHRRAEDVVGRLREDVEASLGKACLIRAEARLRPGRVVEADGELYTAPKILIATGSRPARRLPVPGIELAVSSDELLQADKVPGSIVIIGGGVIGLEFASILSTFGCEVTVVEMCPEILPGFERDIAKRLRTLMGRRGVKFAVNARVTSIDADRTVHYTVKNKEYSAACDCVLAAVGREPVELPGARDCGIEHSERGYIRVNDNFETSVEGVYAVGDVNGLCMLAHAATAQARKAMGEDIDLATVPAVVFTDPECAYVGLTSEKAGDDDRYAAIKVPFGSNGKALASGYDDGMLKLIVEKESGIIAGCHVLGAHASDLVAEASVAMRGHLDVRQLAFSMVHAHPSMSEIFSTACARAAALL